MNDLGFVSSPFLALTKCLLKLDLYPQQEDLLYFMLNKVRNEQIERLDNELDKHGLLRSTFTTLLILYGAPETGMTPSDLACKTGECRTNMTRIGNKLVKMKLVQRAECHQDRRSIKLKLTPNGRLQVENLTPRLHFIVNSYFSLLSHVEQVQLQELLRKMLGNSKKQG